MASAADSTRAALLFAFSAALFLLLARAALLQRGALAADLLLHGRGLLDLLATRTNMVLLCHAILLLILRDAGVLGAAPASYRRSRRLAGETDGAVAACSASVPPAPPWARPHATRSVVVWRRPRKTAAPVYDTADRLIVQRQPPAAAAEWADDDTVAATKLIVLAEEPRDDEYLLPGDDRDRAAIVRHDEQPAASAGKPDCFDRRDDTAREEEEEEEEETAGTIELADDRAFEEFITRQRRKMRQESLRLVIESGRQAAIYSSMLATS